MVFLRIRLMKDFPFMAVSAIRARHRVLPVPIRYRTGEASTFNPHFTPAYREHCGVYSTGRLHLCGEAPTNRGRSGDSSGRQGTAYLSGAPLCTGISCSRCCKRGDSAAELAPSSSSYRLKGRPPTWLPRGSLSPRSCKAAEEGLPIQPRTSTSAKSQGSVY
jgi:hypothetical protein